MQLDLTQKSLANMSALVHQTGTLLCAKNVSICIMNLAPLTHFFTLTVFLCRFKGPGESSGLLTRFNCSNHCSYFNVQRNDHISDDSHFKSVFHCMPPISSKS